MSQEHCCDDWSFLRGCTQNLKRNCSTTTLHKSSSPSLLSIRCSYLQKVTRTENIHRAACISSFLLCFVCVFQADWPSIHSHVLRRVVGIRKEIVLLLDRRSYTCSLGRKFLNGFSNQFSFLLKPFRHFHAEIFGRQWFDMQTMACVWSGKWRFLSKPIFLINRSPTLRIPPPTQLWGSNDLKLQKVR